MGGFSRWLWRAVGAVALLGALPMCREPTQCEVTLRTDVPFVANYTRVGVAPTQGASPSGLAATVDGPWREDGFVGSLTVVPSGDKEAPLLVEAVLAKGRTPESCLTAAPEARTGCIVSRRRLAFVPRTPLRVSIVLWNRCDGVVCGSDETCNRQGACVTAKVDPGSCSTEGGCVIAGDPPPGTGIPTDRLDGGAEAGPPDGGTIANDGGTDGGDAGATRSVVEIAAGTAHVCARFSTGALKCWGWNNYGQLGQPDRENRGDSPGEMAALADVPLPAPVRRVWAGGDHTCALLLDDTVRCWGRNDYGQLGQGDTLHRSGVELPTLKPVEVPPGRVIRDMALGRDHTCALLDNQRVACWGSNAFGQLGIGSTANVGDALGEMGPALTPVPVDLLAVQLTAGAFHTCAIFDDKSARCWGYNGYGQLGLGDAQDRGDQPGEVPPAKPDFGFGAYATNLSAFGDSTCARLNDKTTRCWGYNGSGQLGLGDSSNRCDLGGQTPGSLLRPGTKLIEVIARGSSNHMCARIEDNEVRCWGQNDAGQLGLEDTSYRGDDPGEMDAFLPATKIGSGRTAVAIVLGAASTCVLRDDRRVVCWGDNSRGQLGIGDSDARGVKPGQMGDALVPVDLR